MALIPWRAKRQEESPGQLAVGSFRTEMDRLFDSFFGGGLGFERPWDLAGAAGLPLDVEETDKEITVRAEIPGVNVDDLEISISGGALVISGEKKETEEKREKGYFYQERRFGSFRREIPLPTAVDENDVQAEYKNGVLVVKLKKSQEALPKRIPIKAK
jgi:HSP20 family protein